MYFKAKLVCKIPPGGGGGDKRVSGSGTKRTRARIFLKIYPLITHLMKICTDYFYTDWYFFFKLQALFHFWTS